MKFFLILLLSLSSIAVLFWSAPATYTSLAAAICLLIIVVICVKAYLIDQKNLKTVCNFYQNAHSLDELLLLENERPYQKILKTVVELGDFDWAILFLMDFDEDAFIAVESTGIRRKGFEKIYFDELEPSDNHLNLSLKLLEHAFKKFALEGALAGAAIERDETFYGCLLVGRDDPEAVLSENDNLRLHILSDQISISLHNYQMHKELSLRAEQLAENQARLAKELSMAKLVQDNAITLQAPEFPGLSCACFVRPARFVGGDFLKFFPQPDKEQMALLIGDVCGKGVPAALVMSVMLCLFQGKSELWNQPDRLMHEINLALKDFLGDDSRLNSSAIFGTFDLAGKKLTYASAGHDFPLFYSKKNDQLNNLQSTGTLLGIFRDSEFVASTIQLESGDKIIFYSDGLVDFFEILENVDDGFVALEKFVFARRDKNCDEIVNEIRSLVETMKTDLKDDITLAVIELE
jgi:serine phosphatase RsbU (regulator of sigma subunit)